MVYRLDAHSPLLGTGTPIGESPFGLLRDLIADIPPQQTQAHAHVHAEIGEPGIAPPTGIAEQLAHAVDQWAEYPPLRATETFRAAVGEWFLRYHNNRDRGGNEQVSIDPQTQILPCAGAREALFFLIADVVARNRYKRGGRPPVVLIPEPFYHAWSATPLMLGASVVYVPPAANGLPDYESVPTTIWQDTVAVVLCSPSNPTGSVANENDYRKLLALAETYDAQIIHDACYADAGDAPLLGMAAVNPELKRTIISYSLSKRASVPGLRVGVLVGGKQEMAAHYAVRAAVAPHVAWPLLHVATRLFADDAHANFVRAELAQRRQVAAEVLADYPNFEPPQASFFLWLPVGQLAANIVGDAPPLSLGEHATRQLFRKTGIKSLPGRYLCGPRAATVASPGDAYIRIALVNNPEQWLPALQAALLG